MRHFRSYTDIEQFMADEYRKQGFTVATATGMTIVPISETLETGADVVTEINLTKMALRVWEYLS